MSVAVRHPRPVAPLPARPARPGAAALIVLGLGALTIVAVVTANPAFAVAIPAAAVTAFACARWPAAGLVAVFALASVYGIVQAYEGFDVRKFADFLLVGLWLSVLWQFATGRQRQVWLWPGMLLLPLYVGLTAAEIFTARSVSGGFQSFQYSALPMTCVLLLAISPWSGDTMRRVVKGALIVSGLMVAWNVDRWLVGPSTEETLLARAAQPGVPHHIELRFFGSFSSAQALASWCAIVIPFALAFALAWKGRWRLVAAAVVGGGGFVLVATSVLTGTFAAIAGVIVVVLLYAFSPAFPGGRRLATGVLVSLAIVGVAAVAYGAAVSGSSSSESKFSYLLDPTSEPTFQIRLERWDDALADVDQHPFGRGLGSLGLVNTTSGTVGAGADPTLTNNIDSSYIKIAFEQGIFVLAIFVLALVALFGGMALRSIGTTDPSKVAITLAAAGVLVSMVVQFFGGFYIEREDMLAGWLVVGLGVAQFTARRDEAAESPGGTRPQ